MLHTRLGYYQWQQGKLDEAIAAFRDALKLNPEYPEAHCGLGIALSDSGRLAEALTALKRGHELGMEQPGWRQLSAQWVQQCERLLALEQKLPAMLQGAPPKDAAEQLTVADLCQQPYKRLYAAAARFYADAFAADPKLADNLRASVRYNAACAAALAGCGQGKDDPPPDDQARARLRQQALDWLHADLARWAKQRENAQPETRAAVEKTLRHWQTDPDLAGVRDPEAVAKLPDAERQAWQKLWADVNALLDKLAD
jgi:serine/threonine-protein kinase